MYWSVLLCFQLLTIAWFVGFEVTGGEQCSRCWIQPSNGSFLVQIHHWWPANIRHRHCDKLHWLTAADNGQVAAAETRHWSLSHGRTSARHSYWYLLFTIRLHYLVSCGKTLQKCLRLLDRYFLVTSVETWYRVLTFVILSYFQSLIKSDWDEICSGFSSSKYISINRVRFLIF